MQEDLMKVSLEELHEILEKSQKITIPKVNVRRFRKGSNLKETFYSLLTDINSGTKQQVDVGKVVEQT